MWPTRAGPHSATRETTTLPSARSRATSAASSGRPRGALVHIANGGFLRGRPPRGSRPLPSPPRPGGRRERGNASAAAAPATHQDSTVVRLRSIISKSIFAPRPGSSKACTKPSASTSISSIKPCFWRSVRQQHLEVLAVRNRHQEMQVGYVVQRVAAVVHLVVHVEAFCQMGGLQTGREAALQCHIAAQEVRRLVDHPGCVGRGAGGRKLGGHDRDGEVLL